MVDDKIHLKIGEKILILECEHIYLILGVGKDAGSLSKFLEKIEETSEFWKMHRLLIAARNGVK